MNQIVINIPQSDTVLASIATATHDAKLQMILYGHCVQSTLGNLDIDVLVSILKIGQSAQTFINTNHATDDTTTEKIDQLIETHRTELAQLDKKLHTEMLLAKQATTLANKQALFDLEYKHMQVVSDLDNRHKEAYLALQTSYVQLQATTQAEAVTMKTTLEAACQQKEYELDQQYRDENETLKSEKRDLANKIMYLDTELDKLKIARDTSTSIATDVAKTMEQLLHIKQTREVNSAVKGRDFEIMMAERFEAHYGVCKDYKLERCGLCEMDYKLSIEGNRVLIELKDYKKPLPKSELVKFWRDLDENPEYSVAILISRACNIFPASANREQISTEYRDKKLIIYWSHIGEIFDDDNQKHYFKLLLNMLRIWWYCQEKSTHDDTRQHTANVLNKLLVRMRTCQKELKQTKLHLERSLNSVTTTLAMIGEDVNDLCQLVGVA